MKWDVETPPLKKGFLGKKFTTLRKLQVGKIYMADRLENFGHSICLCKFAQSDFFMERAYLRENRLSDSVTYIFLRKRSCPVAAQ